MLSLGFGDGYAAYWLVKYMGQWDCCSHKIDQITAIIGPGGCQWIKKGRALIDGEANFVVELVMGWIRDHFPGSQLRFSKIFSWIRMVYHPRRGE